MIKNIPITRADLKIYIWYDDIMGPHISDAVGMGK